MFYFSIYQIGVQHTAIARFCGGVILNPNHVLTSGSCVLNENNELIAASQLFVRGGRFLKFSFQTLMKAFTFFEFCLGDVTLGAAAIIPVLLIYVHPHFNPFNHMNDLAVLRVNLKDFNPWVV
jgi:trypsin